MVTRTLLTALTLLLVLAARQIVRHHQYCIESLARPSYRRLFWGRVWLVG